MPVLLIIVALLLLIVTRSGLFARDLFAAKGMVQTTHSELNVTELPVSCRYGVSTNGQSQIDFVDDLKAGWLVNFNGLADSVPGNVEDVPIVIVKQVKDGGLYLDAFTVSPPLTEAGLGQVVDGRPGHLWIVGNEVDRGPDPGSVVGVQGDTFPDVYARAYHDVFHFIKERDPSALVANSALVEVTPGRLQYLDLMWQAYLDEYGTAMPVDVWNMHIYILPEAELDGKPNGIASVALGTDPALAKRGPGQHYSQCSNPDIYCFAEHDDLSIFAEQVLAMRKWMYEHGQRLKPLILSEFSILLPYEQDPGGCFVQDEYGNCFTPARVKNFLNGSMSYLETAVHPKYGLPYDKNRLVQQWNWFSVWSYGVGNVSNLVDPQSGALTTIGQAFRSRANSQQATVNLLPSKASHPAVFTDPQTGTAEAFVEVTVVNNGTYTPDTNFDIGFFKDKDLNELIGTVTVPEPGGGVPGVSGCVRREISAGLVWSDLTPGKHDYWVKIDSGGAIVESEPGGSGENDNVIQAFVLVNPEQWLFPVVSK